MREISNKKHIIDNTILSCFTPISIYQECDLCKCKKAYTQWQNNMMQRDMRAKDSIEIIDKKIHIFEIAQQAQIKNYSTYEDRLSRQKAITSRQIHPNNIIAKQREQNQWKINHIPIGVKTQTSNDEKNLSANNPSPIQKTKITNKNYGQKYENKLIRIK